MTKWEILFLRRLWSLSRVDGLSLEECSKRLAGRELGELRGDLNHMLQNGGPPEAVPQVDEAAISDWKIGMMRDAHFCRTPEQVERLAQTLFNCSVTIEPAKD